MEPLLFHEDATIPAGPTSVALMAWRYRGVLQVTVIAKATFAVACDTAMPRTPPQEIIRAEVHHGNNPGRSIRLTTDLVPYLSRADVIFTGSTYAPAGDVIETARVRLGLFDGARPLLDKALVVHQKGGFKEIPIVYERAFGGVGWPENPFGVGLPSGEPGEPSVLDPDDPRRTAGFGPIGQAWPARRRLLGALPPSTLKRPVPAIPDDFPWEYFQAAPPDQRIGFLRGDEWIVMEGLHPRLPIARTRLPGARGLARVYGLSGFGVSEGQPLALHADMLRIDGDHRQATVTFRGVFPVSSDDALAAVIVVAGVELPGEPIPWPAAPTALAPGRITTSAPAPPGVVPVPHMTMELTDADLESVRAPLPSVLEGTLALDFSAPEDQPAMPFRAGPAAPEVARSSGPSWHASEPTLDTVELPLDEVPIFSGLPFQSEAASAPVTPPPAAVAPPPPPPPPPEVEPPLLAPPASAASKQVVTVTTAAPEASPPPAPAPKPPQANPAAASPTLKKGLYGKFGGNR